jgi:rubrerythrin
VTATRRQLLLAGAAAAALPAAAARAQVPPDVELLESLLALERRLESVYEAALRRDAIDPTLGETLRDHEREHARGLEKGLAGLGRRAPHASGPPELGAALRSREGFARFALELETEAVREYAAAAAALRRPGLRQPLGAIMASEAQHAVALRQSLGEPLLGV